MPEPNTRTLDSLRTPVQTRREALTEALLRWHNNDPHDRHHRLIGTPREQADHITGLMLAAVREMQTPPLELQQIFIPAMRVDELIARLVEVRAGYGNLPVRVAMPGIGPIVGVPATVVFVPNILRPENGQEVLIS